MAKKKKPVMKIVIITLISLIVLFVIAKWQGWIGNEILTEVEISTPSEKEITEIISANGKIQPVTEVKIAPDVSGEIVELNIVEGQKVTKGDLLLKIKPDVYESILERSEASLNSSSAQKEQIKVQLDQAEIDYKRNKKLYEDSAITLADFEKSQTQYENLKAQYKIAEFGIKNSQAALKESTDNLRKTTIYAPMSGTVSLLSIEIGERVVGAVQMTGTEMLRLADLTQMEVKAEVNENDIVRVSVGDTANIEVDAYVGKVFKGVVTQIANTAKATSTADQITNFEVIIFILPESYKELISETNPTPMRPGMSTSVDIITEKKKSISVPVQSIALREIEGKNTEVVFTWQADSSVVKMVPVTTGIQDVTDIEILNGLDTTMKIVTGPYSVISKKLTDKEKVSVKAAK
ncbi:MAG: efflux RND transporter periplasmic adaptor subunit [Rikenellaceae bacterium]